MFNKTYFVIIKQGNILIFTKPTFVTRTDLEGYTELPFMYLIDIQNICNIIWPMSRLQCFQEHVWNSHTLSFYILHNTLMYVNSTSYLGLLLAEVKVYVTMLSSTSLEYSLVAFINITLLSSTSSLGLLLAEVKVYVTLFSSTSLEYSLVAFINITLLSSTSYLGL